MPLENLLGKAKRNALAHAAGLVIAVTSLYSCGRTDMKDPTFIYPKSVYGIYEMHWTELKDTAKLNDKPEGTSDMEIITLGSDERVRFTALSRHTFNRDLENGHICDSWPEIPMVPIEFYIHTVCGNITDDGKVELLVSVNIYNIFNKNIKKMTLEMRGDKKQEEQ